MRNFQQKRGWNSILQSKIVLILLSVLLLFFILNVFTLWGKMQETVKNKTVVENKVAELQQKKDKLSTDISNLKTEQGKEKFFRENYGLAKDGEDVIVIVENKNNSGLSY